VLAAIKERPGSSEEALVVACPSLTAAARAGSRVLRSGRK